MTWDPTAFLDFDIRPATKEDQDGIYLMGYDVWSGGKSESDYLKECRASLKYKRGTWWVLADGDELLSSLIVYDFGKASYGIGSIATIPSARKQGFASHLISEVMADLEDEHPRLKLFLYSDIHAAFYEKFGFKPLPENQQRYKPSLCMAFGEGSVMAQAPDYF